ncbi:phosphatidate cytidylyltransferase [Tractidigestivibacter scatoligenes]|uniref:phosphatidate cytidylyltransferase n=1 Tax=Tractidigestivibacter scatoligenes TaxID=1299998 RepID=UPI002F3598E4
MSEKGPDSGRDKRESVGIDRHIDKLENRRNAKEAQRTAGALAGQRARGWTERLLTRTTSGAIYAIVVLVCLYLGPFATTLMISAMGWLCCSEFFRIARMGGRMPNEGVGLAAAVLFPLAAYGYGLRGLVIILFLLLAACAAWYVFTPRANVGDVAITVFGPLYTSLTFSSLVLVRIIDKGFMGATLTFGVMLSIWANDAMAYAIGSRFGIHKLAPRISPHKSWEGFYGGIVASVIIWAILAAFGVAGLEMPLAILGGLLVGIAGVVGDLFESRLKRGVGVKDSGNLMPGHGGLLDRSDSMLFGSMAAYFVLFFGGIL